MKQTKLRRSQQVTVVGIRRKVPREDLYVKALIEFARQLADEEMQKQNSIRKR